MTTTPIKNKELSSLVPKFFKFSVRVMTNLRSNIRLFYCIKNGSIKNQLSVSGFLLLLFSLFSLLLFDKQTTGKKIQGWTGINARTIKWGLTKTVLLRINKSINIDQDRNKSLFLLRKTNR